jgi:hypothetical protein
MRPEMSKSEVVRTMFVENWIGEEAGNGFAAASAIADRSAVIATVRDNPKRIGSKAWLRYGRYHYAGQTIGQYIAAYVEDGLTAKIAREDLRWDLAHGFITLRRGE